MNPYQTTESERADIQRQYLAYASSQGAIAADIGWAKISHIADLGLRGETNSDQFAP